MPEPGQRDRNSLSNTLLVAVGVSLVCSVLVSVTAIALCPIAAACSTISSGWLAPVRNVKLLVTCSSAYGCDDILRRGGCAGESSIACACIERNIGSR